MAALDADQRGDLALLVDAHDVVGGVGHLESVGIGLDHAVDDVDLFERLADGGALLGRARRGRRPTRTGRRRRPCAAAGCRCAGPSAACAGRSCGTRGLSSRGTARADRCGRRRRGCRGGASGPRRSAPRGRAMEVIGLGSLFCFVDEAGRTHPSRPAARVRISNAPAKVRFMVVGSWDRVVSSPGFRCSVAGRGGLVHHFTDRPPDLPVTNAPREITLAPHTEAAGAAGPFAPEAAPSSARVVERRDITERSMGERP